MTRAELSGVACLSMVKKNSMMKAPFTSTFTKMADANARPQVEHLLMCSKSRVEKPWYLKVAAGLGRSFPGGRLDGS